MLAMTDQHKEKTTPKGEKFDIASQLDDTLRHDRRASQDRRQRSGPAAAARPDNPDRPQPERRAKKERRRRIDPTTFEKQYTDDEIEFMNAMQCFKMQSGRSYPTYGEVLKVAHELGYRKILAHLAAHAIDGPTVRSETPTKAT